MKVTKLEEMGKSRSKIYIDGEFAFVLYKGELRKYGIAPEKDLDTADYQEVMQELLPKRAKLRAMNLLMQRTYTESRLRGKLQEGLYPPMVVEDAIAYVKSFHYIDDVQYAVDYLTYNETTKSRKRMEQDLVAKGIGREHIAEAFQIWEEQGGDCDEYGQLEELLRKKNYHEDMEWKEKQKIAAFLLRKGFSMDAINKSMKNDAFI